MRVSSVAFPLSSVAVWDVPSYMCTGGMAEWPRKTKERPRKTPFLGAVLGGSVPPFKPEAAFGRPERPPKPSLICYTITRRRAVSRDAGCCVHTTCFGGVACFLLHIRRPVAAFTHLYTRLHATSIDGIYTPWYNRGMERQYGQSPIDHRDKEYRNEHQRNQTSPHRHEREIPRFPICR